MIDHQKEYVRVLCEWKNAEATIKHMEDQERAYISRITELQKQIEDINKIANNPYPTNPFRLNKIREILKSEFKEKTENV